MRVVFMGTGDIALPALRWLIAAEGIDLRAVVCQPDRPVGRRQVVTPPRVKQVADGAGIPVLQPERVRREDAVGAVAARRPDLILVMAYGQILPKALLEVPPLGCVNLHASILPAHRGAAPVHAAVLAGDAESGITAMLMDEGMDTGDILHVERMPLSRRETASSLHDKLAVLAPRTLDATLDGIRRGCLVRIPQEHALATHAPKLGRESGRIDWSRDCHALDRHVRGMHAWPGAFTTFPVAGGPALKLKVHSALPCHRLDGRPGEVVRRSRRGLAVACGSGGLFLRVVQPEGGRPMGASAFAAGHTLPPGRVLGEAAE